VKPVWVSIGGMAASGGYYIAVAGERIYVTESSIVGSIGVVGGKLSMQGLYDKFQVKVVMVV
jgi:protease-4